MVVALSCQMALLGVECCRIYTQISLILNQGLNRALICILGVNHSLISIDEGRRLVGGGGHPIPGKSLNHCLFGL